MTPRWHSHWLWFVLLLTAVSMADYFDHILRPGAPFGARPWTWLGFTAASHVSVVLITLGLARLLARMPLPTLATDTLALVAAIAFHLLIGGPLWNEIFWPEGSMQFATVWVPMALGAAAYLAFRGAFWLIQRGIARLRA